MRTILTIVVSSLALAAPVFAAEGGINLAVGYAFATYLESGGGSAPLGIAISAFRASPGPGLEADFAYHRDTGYFTLNTLTAGVGGRFAPERPGTSPYAHLLLLVRYDWVEGASNTSAGGMIGGGIDFGREGVRPRLGVDFQLFRDQGESLKVLRSTAGVRF